MTNFKKKFLSDWTNRELKDALLFFVSCVSCLLLLYVLLKEHDFIFFILQRLRDSIYNVDVLLFNIDFWSSLGAFGSFIVAIAVAYITWSYNKHMKIQNKLAFEEFRPNLEIKKDGGNNKITIVNKGTFEAINIFYLYKRYDSINKKMGKIYKKDDYQSFLLSPGAEKELDCDGEGYYSYLVFYENYSSGVVYVNGFNFKKGDSRNYTIGDLGVDMNAKPTLPSPINKEIYLNLLDNIKLENQINKNIDISELVDDLIKEIS